MSKEKTETSTLNLTGKMIAAVPSLDSESFFYKTVIYIAKHNRNGARGVIINQPIALKLSTLLDSNKEQETLVDAYLGGPHSLEQFFTLHSNKDSKPTLRANLSGLDERMLPTFSKDEFVVLGQCRWERGQLEEEIAQDHWLVLPSCNHLIFNVHNDEKWPLAIDRLNIHPANYSRYIGNC